MHPKQKIHKNKKHLEWIRQKPCLICRSPGPNDSHHVWNSGKKNHGNDFLVVPLCRTCHSDYHHLGHNKFEEKWNVNLRDEIINLLSEFIDEEKTNQKYEI